MAAAAWRMEGGSSSMEGGSSSMEGGSSSMEGGSSSMEGGSSSREGATHLHSSWAMKAGAPTADTDGMAASPLPPSSPAACCAMSIGGEGGVPPPVGAPLPTAPPKAKLAVASAR